MAKCGRKCEVYSRIVGYFRPISQWNRGKREEFKDRKNFVIPDKEIKKENNYDGKQQ